jgi:hypothetical protein
MDFHFDRAFEPIDFSALQFVPDFSKSCAENFTREKEFLMGPNTTNVTLVPLLNFPNIDELMPEHIGARRKVSGKGLTLNIYESPSIKPAEISKSGCLTSQEVIASIDRAIEIVDQHVST